MLDLLEASTSSIPVVEIGSKPFSDQDQLVDAQLDAIRVRVRAVNEAAGSGNGVPASDSDAMQWRADVRYAEASIEARIAQSTCELPIQSIRDRFGLSATEERVLWLLIAQELCPSTRELIRSVGTEQAPDPTTDTLRRIVYGRASNARMWRELGHDGTLRRFGFVERTDGNPETPEHRQTWKITGRVLALVNGEVGVDPALAEIAAIDDRACLVDELELAGNVSQRVVAAFDRGGLVLVHGRVGSGKRSLLAAVAAAHARRVLRVDGRSIAKEREVAQRQLRAIARECRLLDALPLVRDLDALSPTADTLDRIDLVERALDGLVLATSSRPIARRWKRAPSVIELAPITGVQRASLWARALPMASTGDTELLATMYPLAPSMIEAAGRLAIENCAGDKMQPEHIEAGLRGVLDDRLAGLATRITVTQTWDDIVLPDDQATAIIELLARIRERRKVYEDWGFADKVGRGLGVSALFSGPPGTGKTMAAGLVAKALNTELYQVDLSKIVSKWIGETEKNLAALFDAAEAGHAILLFDEADALFGKRTDVRSSNDRHANQEVNFLLQRLESYAGICILTTNHDTAIDEAFRRRLSVHVRFPMPQADERQKLWRAMIPKSAPTTGDLAFEQLAETFAMSGGYIRNAVLRAAFLAADENGRIDATRLARAAQLEYEALGKIVASKH
jgi:ATP-dependent 26S proteasome regulatory subunit